LVGGIRAWGNGSTMAGWAVDVCMTGPKLLDQMREALRAVDLGPLDADEFEGMRRIGDHLRGRRS